ncbi:hypothetical protein TherJR_2181 [Calderihabitans maritimus]|uniref:Uncharacterized protein n=1 Tax=Calderihabitans maritimus TaxID=1246530 RepID=A0A1Z5HR58_9FIRM|nr:hypothetical protein TherJR_2181 [Calderihabitans maritimus]
MLELTCPLCNGLKQFYFPCPQCSRPMEDRGALENFFGPYSPYETHPLFFSSTFSEKTNLYCVHLFACPGCGKDKRIKIRRIEK